jgi:hypothetical protein
MKRTISALGLAGLALAAPLLAQNAGGTGSGANRLITRTSAGPVRMGMTVAQARKALGTLKLRRASDGEGMALIEVRRGSQPVMTLYAGEADPSRKIDERARIEHISVRDPGYSTREGVRPGMKLGEVEKRYGRLRYISVSEIESREYAVFTRTPAGFQFRVDGPGGRAGKYNLPPAPGARSRHYVPAARIRSVEIAGRPKG